MQINNKKLIRLVSIILTETKFNETAIKNLHLENIFNPIWGFF